MFYKFRPIFTPDQKSFVKDIIIHNKFYFAPESAFFDPFEFTYSKRSVIKTNRQSDNVGILSLSKTNKDLLMWSFYADWHRGICMGFKYDNKCLFFNSAKKINYVQSYPKNELLKIENHDEKLYKSIRWQHEKEWRIIKVNSANSYVHFPENALTEITFGINVSSDSIDEVISWIPLSKIKNINLKKAVISPENYSILIQQL